MSAPNIYVIRQRTRRTQEQCAHVSALRPIRCAVGSGSVQSFSHIWFGLSGDHRLSQCRAASAPWPMAQYFGGNHDGAAAGADAFGKATGPCGNAAAFAPLGCHLSSASPSAARYSDSVWSTKRPAIWRSLAAASLQRNLRQIQMRQRSPAKPRRIWGR
jgi:hypothetical protein